MVAASPEAFVPTAAPLHARPEVAPAPLDRQADRQHLAALDLAREPIWIFDIDHRRVHWGNQASLSVWQADSLDELCRRDMGKDMSSSVAARLAQYQADFIDHDAEFDELWTLYPAGKPVSLNVHYSGYRLPDQRMAMLCQGRPTEAHTPDSLRSVEALLHTQVMISLYRHDGVPLYRNPAARASVRTHEEPLQARFADAAAGRRLLAVTDDLGSSTLTMPIHTSQGLRWHEVSAQRRHDAVTGEAAVLISEVDVTSLKQSEAQALYLSAHDSLTGLANRDSIQQRFQDMAAGRSASPTASPTTQAALILIDLDRFKDINDTLGHAAGDELIVQVAGRLKQAVRRNDVVARFGGDEFLILLRADDIHREIGHVEQRLRRAIGSSLHIGGTSIHVSASIGVSLYPDHGTDFNTLLQHADLAMYSAKTGGRDALAFYDAGMSAALRHRTALEADLRQALQQQQFELHYQPRVCIGTGRIVGAEALVRWRHPQRGLVPPDQFIPVCEATGLIRDLGRQVFRMAASQQALWNRAGHALKLSVNLSPCEFDDAGLLSDLERTLADSGCAPETLQLEITESMLMHADDKPLRTLQALRALGLSIALDDFGTGYSNLAYLQRFPFSVLKIDRAFVQVKPSERPLTEAIVAMSRSMGLHTVAEGIETPEHLSWLNSLGVTEYQGFLFSRPVPLPDFNTLLRTDARTFPRAIRPC